MTKFDNLPVDCVQLVFNRLPTRTLLHIRQVCHFWNAQQEIICRTRKTLILLSGKSSINLVLKSNFESNFIAHQINSNGQPKNWNAYLDRNKLKLNYDLTREIVDLLVKTFPRVHTIIVAQHLTVPAGTENPLVYLLHKYSHQLSTLKLHLKYHSPNRSARPPSEYVDQLYQSFNSLTSLEHLTLECNEPQYAIEPLKCDLNFMTWVKEFYCYTQTMPKVWFDCLAEFESAGRMTQLEKIAFESNDIMQPELSISIDQWPVRMRFVHFPTISWFKEPVNLNHLAQFPSLCTLLIDRQFVPNSLTRLSHKLSPLSNLVHLGFIFNAEWLKIPADRESNLQQISTVKAIDLIFYQSASTLRQYYPSLRTLAALLPNVESIRFVDLRTPNNHWTRSYTQEDYMQGNALAFLDNLKPIFGRHIRIRYCDLESYVKYFD